MLTPMNGFCRVGVLPLFLLLAQATRGTPAGAQTMSSRAALDSAEVRRDSLQRELGQLQGKIDSLRALVSAEWRQENSDSLPIIAAASGSVYELASPAAHETCFLFYATPVRVTGCVNGMLRIVSGDTVGFVSVFGVQKDSRILELLRHCSSDTSVDRAVSDAARRREKSAASAAAQQVRNRQKRQAAAEAERSRELTKRFGSEVGRRLSSHEVWIGMTREMARESWGPPSTINRTVTASSVHEQWVYRRAYLYFDGDVLTAWQD